MENGIGPPGKEGPDKLSRISSIGYVPRKSFCTKNHHGKERCEKRSVLLETEGDSCVCCHR